MAWGTGNDVGRAEPAPLAAGWEHLGNADVALRVALIAAPAAPILAGEP